MNSISFHVCVGLTTIRLCAATLQEDFSTDPFQDGWKIQGSAKLFEWNSTAQNLNVTWDSSQSNSYFYRSLGTVLSKSDNLHLTFDLTLSDVAVGMKPNQPYTFELAIGFLNFKAAASTNFHRGLGTQSPDLVEFDYFPDSGFGATISPVIVSSNSQFIPSFTFPVELTPGVLFHVEMSYDGASETLSTMLKREGGPAIPIKDVKLGGGFTDFRVDTIAIASYSDQGADGSLLAHGAIDNLAMTIPDPPITSVAGSWTNQIWKVQFPSRTNWTYFLERTVNFVQWQPVSIGVKGNASGLALEDGGPIESGSLFYRVRAERLP